MNGNLLVLAGLTIAERQVVAGSNLRIERLGGRRDRAGSGECGQGERDWKMFSAEHCRISLFEYSSYPLRISHDP
jgi:hypothetical protein